MSVSHCTLGADTNVSLGVIFCLKGMHCQRNTDR